MLSEQKPDAHSSLFAHAVPTSAFLVHTPVVLQ